MPWRGRLPSSRNTPLKQLQLVTCGAFSSSWVLLTGIIALAVILRLDGLAAVALNGDEYRSISESTTRLGVNLTSLLYVFILRLFLMLGSSVEILRLPAAVFGVCAVLACYLLGKALFDRTAGLVAALLMAISSYAIGYSQQVRFYSLFLFSGVMALYALALILRDGPTPKRLVWLLVANILCLASHTLGILTIGAEVVSYLLLTTTRERYGRRALFLAAVVAFGGLLVANPHVRSWGFYWVTRSFDSTVPYTEPRGVHLANVVKVAWTFFVFTFGERVYPLWLGIVVPGMLVVAVLLARGLWALRHNRLAIGILLPQLILGPVVLYFVLDALIPPDLQGASPRYLIPLLGPFLVLIAAGLTSWRAHWAIVFSLLLILGLNGATLWDYWQNAWDYNGYTPDWQRVAALVARNAEPGTLILVDGRSVDPARYYLSDIERARHLGQVDLASASLATVRSAPRLIVVSNTDRSSDQATINVALEALQTRYTVMDGFVRYPLFAYVLDRSAVPRIRNTVASSSWQPVPLPVEVYGLEFEDLALPAVVTDATVGFTEVTRGALALAATPTVSNYTFTLPPGSGYHTLLVATTLEEDAAIANGSPVATAVLTGRATSQAIILRKGVQVDDWQRVGSRTPPSGAEYTTGYTWTKLVSLVGERSYPDAYHQFTAGIAVAALPLSGRDFRTITFHYLAATGALDIWAAAIR